jgi:hypothetical protein
MKENESKASRAWPGEGIGASSVESRHAGALATGRRITAIKAQATLSRMATRNFRTLPLVLRLRSEYLCTI